MALRKALLVGASGLIGNHCLHFLLKSDQYQQVTVLVRRKLTLTHPKLIEHQIDFDKLDAHQDLLMADDVYCCLGTTLVKSGSKAAFRQIDFDYTLKLAQLCHANGVSQFLLVTSQGATAKSMFFYLKLKAEIEQAVADIGFESLQIIRPALLLGKRQENRPFEAFGQAIGRMMSIVFAGPLKKHRPIEAQQVAQAMVELGQKAQSGTHFIESKQMQ